MTDSRSPCLTDAQLLELVQGKDSLPQWVEHLTICSACGERLSDLQETWVLLGAVSQPTSSRDLSGRILTEAARGSAPFPWLRVAAVFVVGSVVGMMAAFGVPHGSGPVAAPLGPQQVIDSLGLDALGIDPELAHSLSDIPFSAGSYSEENAL